MKTPKSAVYAIEFSERKEALRLTRQGGWRPVLAQVDRWTAAAQAAGLPVDPEALTELGAAGLSLKGARIPVGILDRGLLPDVPPSWLKTAASHAQDDLLVELVRRADPAALRASQGRMLGAQRDRDALGWALTHGLLASLDAFIAHGCRAENALIQLLCQPDEERAAAVVPRALALGAPRDRFPSGFSTYRLKSSYAHASPSTPLEAALVRRQPVLALALIEAGADPSSPAMKRSYEDKPSTTALHLGLEELVRRPQPFSDAYPKRPHESSAARLPRIAQAHEKAVLALLARASGLPSWWVVDTHGRRAAELESPPADPGLRWLKQAEDWAYLVDMPAAKPARGPKPRL